jgi:hypothetical protein
MSDHDRFRELLVLRTAGEVDAHDVLALDAHLSMCGACREETFGLLRLAPPPPIDDTPPLGFIEWRKGVAKATFVPHRRQRWVLETVGVLVMFFLGHGSSLWIRSLPQSDRDRPEIASAPSERPTPPSPPPAPFERPTPPPPAPTTGYLGLASLARGR